MGRKVHVEPAAPGDRVCIACAGRHGPAAVVVVLGGNRAVGGVWEDEQAAPLCLECANVLRKIVEAAVGALLNARVFDAPPDWSAINAEDRTTAETVEPDERIIDYRAVEGDERGLAE